MKKYYIQLCLCIFGGFLGLHYWYTKKYKKAILFLLTGGGMGIWYIYDIVRLILNKNYLSECVVENKMVNHNISIENKDLKFESINTPVKSNTNDIYINEVDLKVERILSEQNKRKKEIDKILNKDLLSNTELYLQSFNNIKKYDINKQLDEALLKKIKRIKDVDYEKFIKPSGTTERPSSFVVFDLETTGLNAATNEIIEIGAIRFSINKPEEIFHTYIKPNKKISEKITSINGINNQMVENCPSIEEVIPRFIDFIGEDVLVAHNSNFDMEFILNQLYNQGYKKIKNKAIDTLKLSRQKIREYDCETDKYKKLDSYKLENLKYAFSLWDVGSHNAIDDCKVCAYVYMKIINEYGDFCYVD